MLSGLSQAGIRQVNYALSIKLNEDGGTTRSTKASASSQASLQLDHNLDLASAGPLFLRLFRAIDTLAGLIEMELVETKEDLSYWRDLGESVEVAGSFELWVAKVHSRLNPWAGLFGEANTTPHGSETALLLTAEESIYSLSTDMQKLCSLLARVKDSNDCLKCIYIKVQGRDDSDWTSTDLKRLRRDAQLLLDQCVDNLRDALDKYVPKPGSSNQQSGDVDDDAWTRSSLPERCSIVEARISALQQSTHTRWTLWKGGGDLYPIGINKVARRPPDWQRRWVGDVSSAFFGAVAVQRFAKYWQLGLVQSKTRQIVQTVRDILQEYLDKASAAYALLAKVTASSSIISENEVLDARETLSTALKKWVSEERGKRWLLLYYCSHPKGSVPELEAQMGALRLSFEADISRPFWGLVRGDLAPSIFIQGLEMSEKMLEAMLQADTAMAKNQLTMVLTSIMPAFVIGAAAYLLTRALLCPLYPLLFASASTSSADSRESEGGGGGGTKARLRHLLSELEHSLVEVYSYMEAEKAWDLERRLGGVGVGLGLAGGGGGLMSPRHGRSSLSFSFLANPNTNPNQLNASSSRANSSFSLPSPLSSSSSSSSSSAAAAAGGSSGGAQVTSGGEEELGEAISFPSGTSRLEVARGQLCFDILRLRKALQSHFLDKGMLSRLFTVLYDPGSVVNFLPFRLIYRVWTGRSAKREGSAEYTSLLKDLLKLESSDEEVPRNIKINIISKFKSSPCFRPLV